MQKRKILFLITKGNFGGAQRYVYDLSKNLPKDKFEVIVALGEGETLERKLKEAGVRTRKIITLQRNISFVKDFIAFFEIAKIIKEENPDIVHINSSKAGGLGALAVRLHNFYSGKKIKAIFTGHGWAFNEERDTFSKILIAIAHWLTLLLSHKVIAVSEKVKNQIRIFPFTKGKIVVIHNGIEKLEFLDKSEAKNAFVLGKNNLLWIGTIAELHKNKGLDFAIEAFGQISNDFRNTIFVIIGEGEEKNNLQALIRKLNLEDRVFLVGFKENAYGLLKAFDIALFTSRTEAFPYVPLEMGLAELPVIASWVGGIPEIIINKESGILVQKGNIDEISLALLELIKDENMRKILGENLRNRVLKNFNLNKMIEKTTDLYIKLCSSI